MAAKAWVSRGLKRFQEALLRTGMTGRNFRELGPYPPVGYIASSFFGSTKEASITNGIVRAKTDGVKTLFIPKSMLPYDPTLVTRDPAVHLVCEGGPTSDFEFDVRAYGASDNGTGNDALAIQAALDMMPANGGVLVLGSHHRIATTVTISKFTTFLGKGRRVLPGTAPTRLLKASTLSGPAVLLTGGNSAHGSIIQGFQLDGEAGNLGDGVVIGTNYATVRDVTVTGMGQDGFRIGRDTATNVNLWLIENCFARSNGRHGFNIDDPAGVPDANAGTLIHCDASVNTGDGCRVGKVFGCTFVGLTTQVNTGAGLRLTGLANLNEIVSGDFDEGNVGGNIVVETGALDNDFLITYRRDMVGITDNGTRTSWHLRDGTVTLHTARDTVSFVDQDTTPSVRAGTYFHFSNTVATSVTYFDDGHDQQEIDLRLDNNTTLVHNTSLMRLKGSVNVTGVNSNAFIRLRRISAIWFEQFRSF